MCANQLPKAALQRLPLQDKRILVTRTREQAGVLSERLSAVGAIPIEFPTIRIVPPTDWHPLDTALQHVASHAPGYDWLIFTSVNGVKMCFERLHLLGYDGHVLDGVRIAAIGPATAAALAQYGTKADLVPDEYIAESVATALLADATRHGTSLVGKRILLARAAEARRVLVTQLQAASAIVDEVAAYRTIAVASDDAMGQTILELLNKQQLDILTFTSSSTVRNFMHWLSSCTSHPTQLLTNVIIACIGPITSQTARELGLTVHIEAAVFTIDGLVEALVQHEREIEYDRANNRYPA